MQGGLKVENLTVMYAGQTALDAVNLEVMPGSLTALLGPSGCGKSTLLNAVAGLIEPSAGRIEIDNKVAYDGTGRSLLQPHQRNVGMVFQSYALWPHLTVEQNLSYPCKRRGMSKTEIKQRVSSTLDSVRCANLAARYPSELSGGQQQRVALARAIVANPSMILFDEPLSNLDANLRSELRDEISRLHELYKFTGIYVTHDRGEALSLGSQVAVMEAGLIRQLGSPSAVYDSPSSAYVAGFLGANILEGVATSATTVRTLFGEVGVNAMLTPGENIKVAIYPKDVKLVSSQGDDVRITVARYLGSGTEIMLERNGVPPIVAFVSQEMYQPSILGSGNRVRLSPDTRAVVVEHAGHGTVAAKSRHAEVTQAAV